MKLFICDECGKIVAPLNGDGGCTPACCGKEMRLLAPNVTEAATEKHLPAVRVDNNKVIVTVGSTMHPMLEEHRIQFVLLETTDGIQMHQFKVGDEPRCVFALADGVKAVAAYANCNLHGLWKTEI